MLGDTSKTNYLYLFEVGFLHGSADYLDGFFADDTTFYNGSDRIAAFQNLRDLFPVGELYLIHLVISRTFTFHQFQCVAEICEVFVSFYCFMKDILWGYSQWQSARVDYFDAVGMDVYEYISCHCIRAVYQGVAYQLTNHILVVSRYLLAEQPFADFVRFTPVGYFRPYILDYFFRRHGEIIPQIFSYFLSVLIIFDALHNRSVHQSSPLRLCSYEQHTEIGHTV